MNTRFVLFISVLTAILCVSTLYVGSRLIAESGWGSAHRGVVWLSLGLFVILQILGPYLYRVYPNHSSRLFVLHWATYTTLGLFACMLFYIMAADLFWGLWQIISNSTGSIHMERMGFMTVLAMTLGSVVIGITQAARGPKIYDVEIPLENLPQELDGFKIVQITDLHVGPTIGPRYIRKVVEMANGLAPDLVALTGDFVDGTVAHLQSAIDPISQIKARHGMFFVTGNHEYYWGVQGWINEFQKLGARVLLNEHAVIRENGCNLVIAGVADRYAGQMFPSHTSDPIKAMEGAPENAVKILLAHQPASYKEASEAGFHLQLSGHTHGGQFFPWSILVGLTHRYYRGLSRHENMWIYVSRGAGYWGPPLRFTVPAEITLLRLRRAGIS